MESNKEREDRQKSEDRQKRKDSIRTWSLIVAGFAVFLSLFVIPLVLAYFNNNGDINWLLYAVWGVMAFLICLTTMAVVFNLLSMQNKDEALGLPPGSVRAVIALALIVIFVISFIYLYSDLANPAPRAITDLSQEQYNNINATSMMGSIKRLNAQNETVYDVYLTPPMKSQASEDLAKQVITMVGTLMVSVSSFYFGTKSSEGAQQVGKETTPSIFSPVSSAKISKEEGKTLTINLKTTPEGEAIVWEPPKGDRDGTLIQINPGEFKYTRGTDPQDQVVLKFSLVKYPDAEKQIKIENE